MIVIVSMALMFFPWYMQNTASESKPTSAFNSVERCDKLRDSGFFASVGLPATGTEPNSREDQQSMYQNCLNRAP